MTDTNNRDLEQECEDAVFELCDVRERIPTKCANEFGEYLSLISRINMKAVRLNVTESLDNTVLTDDQKQLFQQVDRVLEEDKESKKVNDNITKMMTEVNSLRIVLQQIKNSQVCPIYCATKN